MKQQQQKQQSQHPRMIQRSFVWLKLMNLVQSGDITRKPYRVTNDAWKDYTNLTTAAAGGPTTLMFKNLTNGRPRGAHWLIPWTKQLREAKLIEPFDRMAASVWNSNDPEHVTLVVGLESHLDVLRAGYTWRAGFWGPPTPLEIPDLLRTQLRAKHQKSL